MQFQSHFQCSFTVNWKRMGTAVSYILKSCISMPTLSLKALNSFKKTNYFIEVSFSAFPPIFQFLHGFVFPLETFWGEAFTPPPHFSPCFSLIAICHFPFALMKIFWRTVHDLTLLSGLHGQLMGHRLVCGKGYMDWSYALEPNFINFFPFNWEGLQLLMHT